MEDLISVIFPTFNGFWLNFASLLFGIVSFYFVFVAIWSIFKKVGNL